MRAAQYTEHGGPEVLNVIQIPDPEPGPADVVVRVEACALNRLDVAQRNGWFTLDGFTLPHVAGMDLAGTVVAAGSEVNAAKVAVGDRVVVDPSLVGVADGSKLSGRGDLYGELGVIGANADGGYAELCLAPATHVYAVPDSMPIEHAATFPTCYLTATHALFDVAKLSAGETVMIHAAGSGVSVAAIQLAKRAGATVLATAGSQSKLDKAIELGADHVLNNRTGDVTGWAREVTNGRGVDVVFDHVGQALFSQSLFSLAVGGRLVSCGNTSGDEAAIPSLGYMFHGRISILGSDAYRPEEFGPAWEKFCGGDFAVHIDREYPLEEAAAAQEQLVSGDVFGKILLRPQVS
ncbi:MAG: NADPH:quinone reductase-like Zn-dependent oxidoreductase [Candidatus Aldehydirespiratoraceae bacterium]